MSSIHVFYGHGLSFEVNQDTKVRQIRQYVRSRLSLPRGCPVGVFCDVIYMLPDDNMTLRGVGKSNVRNGEVRIDNAGNAAVYFYTM